MTDFFLVAPVKTISGPGGSLSQSPDVTFPYTAAIPVYLIPGSGQAIWHFQADATPPEAWGSLGGTPGQGQDLMKLIQASHRFG